MSLDDISVDLSAFEEIPSPHVRRTACRLSFSKEDQLMQNEAFRQQTKDAPGFRPWLSPDGRTLFLSAEEPHTLTFTPTGLRTHHPLGDMLRRRSLEPPVSYLLTWREDLGGWLGVYDGLAQPPKPAGRRRRDS